MEERLALQATLLKEKIEHLGARFRELKQNLSTINDSEGNNINQNESYVEKHLQTKLNELKHSLVSSVLSIYHDYDFTIANDTMSNANPNESELLESIVKKLRNNLDSSTERKKLNDVFTKQAIAKHLKKLKTLESMSANLFHDIVKAREGVTQTKEILSKVVPNITGKPQDKQLSAQIMDYLSKTSRNQTAELLCVPSPTELLHFPRCLEKILYFTQLKDPHVCYKENGVDGSVCSFRRYLSEVESFCPLMPGRNTTNTFATNIPQGIISRTTKATLNINLDLLLAKLRDPNPGRLNYEFVRRRIKDMWPRWTGAAKSLLNKQPYITDRPVKQILIFMGLISKKAGLQFVDKQFKGAPLGELVQWSDIIASHFVLGHNITITSEVEQLTGSSVPCPVFSTMPVYDVDIIYTDIIGFRIIMSQVKHLIANRCKFRIIDSFGTEAAFNYPPYVAKHSQFGSLWGGNNLLLKQYCTMYPHSPDNSFMGFVIPNHFNSSEHKERKNQAVVYGKSDYMWKGSRKYLDIIHEYAEIHATVAEKNSTNVPDYVKNHGILNSKQLYDLLRESKIFVGLGFPYEGPAPLEAISQGCVFLNPGFNPPKNAKNTKFFQGKPTFRAVTSQNPYAEEYIAEPDTLTFDMNNEAEVRNAVKTALQSHDDHKIIPHIPYEYTDEGMLQRVDVLLHKQNFCDKNAPIWPPESAVSVEVTEPNQSCKDLCHVKGKVCEPVHFPRLNTEEALENYFQKANLSPNKKICLKVIKDPDIYYPAYEPANQKCILQEQPMLYSCVGMSGNLRRICPCRDFIPGQTALCRSCL